MESARVAWFELEGAHWELPSRVLAVTHSAVIHGLAQWPCEICSGGVARVWGQRMVACEDRRMVDIVALLYVLSFAAIVASFGVAARATRRAINSVESDRQRVLGRLRADMDAASDADESGTASSLRNTTGCETRWSRQGVS